METFFSGYCRVLDCSRLVEVECEPGMPPEADCCYGDCVYQSSCPIAKQIDALANKDE